MHTYITLIRFILSIARSLFPFVIRCLFLSRSVECPRCNVGTQSPLILSHNLVARPIKANNLLSCSYRPKHEHFIIGTKNITHKCNPTIYEVENKHILLFSAKFALFTDLSRKKRRFPDNFTLLLVILFLLSWEKLYVPEAISLYFHIQTQYKKPTYLILCHLAFLLIEKDTKDNMSIVR